MDPHITHFSKLLVEKIGKAALSKTCSKGVFVFMEGARYLGPWVLHKGSAVLVKSSSGGKEQILRQIEPGEVFAEVPIFKNVDWYPVNARCVTACELSLLPAEDVKRLLKSDPELAWAAACALAGRVAEFRDFVFDLTLASAQQRLLRYLLRRLEGKPNASLGLVRVGISHQDLALLLGIRPESLSRALTELEASGKLKRLSRQTFQIFLKQIQAEDRDW
ncbi:MAG: Crp/Fnr family transcriptional regulator [Verrucomicrobia bacterium]|nr:Crp/Fnr family transcriptional regulator [Verrucomicrobiota bacterium]